MASPPNVSDFLIVVEITQGLAADVVIFDPETVADRSTWVDPVQPPVGVKLGIRQRYSRN